MSARLPISQIFPIRDAASAKLAQLKADYLYEAGVIDADVRSFVYARSAAALPFHETMQSTVDAALSAMMVA